MRAITPAELAEQLGCHVQFVTKRAAQGDWPHLKVGRKTRFTPAHVDRILEMVEHRPGPRSDGRYQKLLDAGFTPRSANYHVAQLAGAASRHRSGTKHTEPVGTDR